MSYTEVIRYDFYEYGGMLSSVDGDYVRHDAYQDLQRQLAEESALLAVNRNAVSVYKDTVADCEIEIEKLEAQLAEANARNAELLEALTRLRDCDWVISLPDRMDAVRDMARKAIASVEDKA